MQGTDFPADIRMSKDLSHFGLIWTLLVCHVECFGLRLFPPTATCWPGRDIRRMSDSLISHLLSRQWGEHGTNYLQ